MKIVDIRIERGGLTRILAAHGSEKRSAGYIALQGDTGWPATGLIHANEGCEGLRWQAEAVAVPLPSGGIRRSIYQLGPGELKELLDMGFSLCHQCYAPAPEIGR